MTKGKKAIIFQSSVSTGVDGRSCGSVVAIGSKGNIPVARKLAVTLLCHGRGPSTGKYTKKGVFWYLLYIFGTCCIFLALSEPMTLQSSKGAPVQRLIEMGGVWGKAEKYDSVSSRSLDCSFFN